MRRRPALVRLAPAADPVAQSYQTHPLLDPFLPRRHPSVARRWLGAHRSIARDPVEARRLERAFISPVGGGGQAPHQSLDA